MTHEPKTLDGFLQKYKTRDGKPVTHTRIGSPEHGIYGGSYSIPDEKKITHFIHGGRIS